MELCADNLTMFAITEAKGLNGIDGILGFSPANASEPMENNTSIVRALHEAGMIDDAVATFQINGKKK